MPVPHRARAAFGWGLALGLALAAPVGAEDSRDGVTLHPSLRVIGVFDDNPFTSGEDPQSDWGVWVVPRLEIDAVRGRLHAGLDLSGELRRYRRHAALDQHFWTLLGFGELDLGRGFQLRVADAYVPRPLVLGRPTDDGPNRIQTNRADAELRWRRPLRRGDAVELGLRATRFDTDRFVTDLDTNGDGVLDARRAERGNYEEFAADLEWQRSLGRRALLYLRGEARERSFDELSEVDFRELAGFTGVRVRGTRRLSLDAGIGWGRLSFDSGRDQDRLLLRTQVRWQGSHQSAELTLGRQFTADIAGQEYVETSGRLELERELGRRTRAGVGFLISHFESSVPGSASNRFFGTELWLDRQLRRRLHGRLAWRHWRNGGDDEFDDFHQNRVTLELVYRR